MQADFIPIRFCSQAAQTNNYTSKASGLKDIHSGLMLPEESFKVHTGPIQGKAMSGHNQNDGSLQTRKQVLTGTDSVTALVLDFQA